MLKLERLQQRTRPVFPDLSSDAARAELEPFHDVFIGAIKEGVSRFNTIEPTLLYVLVRSKRVKANCVWAFIVDAIETAFRDVPEVRVVPRAGSVEIEIGTNTVARIKKMRPDGFTSNYMTARVTAFHSADQGELFEYMWAQPMRVDIGYIEDETGTQVAEIMVARRSSPAVIAWTYSMTTPPDVMPMPVSPKRPVTPPVPAENTRVVAREDKKHHETQGTDDR